MANRELDTEGFADIVRSIIARTGQGGVLYLPTMSAGEDVGRYLEREFQVQRVPYAKLPAVVKKSPGRVLYPSLSEFEELDGRMAAEFGPGYTRLIWDEAIAQGTTALILYDFLLEAGVSDRSILIASYLDRAGITEGLTVTKGYERTISRGRKRAALKRDGVITASHAPSLFSKMFGKDNGEVERAKELYALHLRPTGEPSPAERAGQAVIEMLEEL
ncbi:MAG: hypothetical protein HY369_00255 [Candidatus Aenigmarchaeota archaeon]|nr:hypothetical protein [Candidatus Aenigmarchaeota archaeon]